MALDTIVLDIETKNTFADVGGQQNVKKLEASFIGVYSYRQNKYLSFFENQFVEFNQFLKNTKLIIGFSINRFDMPVLEKYCDFNIQNIPCLDLLEEIEIEFGNRISLNILAQTNLGIGKTAHGLEAIKFYKEGRLEDLEKYCLQDVRLTKELYELIEKQGYLLLPKKNSEEIVKVKFNWLSQELLF